MKAYRGLLGCLLAALLYALPTSASAQCSGIFSAGEVCGNSTASGTLAARASLTAMFDRAFCGTNNSTTIRLAGTWVCLSLGTGVPAFLTTPSSANLRAALTDETGTGVAVFGTSPAIATASFTGANTFTNAGPSAIDVRSGASGSTAQTSWGRTAAEANLGIAAGSNQFVTGTVAGDTALLAQTNLWLAANGSGTAAGIALIGSTKATTVPGVLAISGASSGATTIQAASAASGTWSLPAATDTFTGKATTDTLTNKTFDTAGTGNSFSINGVAATANTGTGAVVRATSPVLVMPALGTPASGVLTNATGLPLSGLTTQGAFTFVGNNTSGTAVPTAVDIAALTSKASPAASDLIMLSDQAASGAWKKATVSSVASAGSVSSIAGNTGAFTLGVGLTNSVNDIRTSLSTASNSLGADVALNNTANYFDGPSAAQGTAGTWYCSGSVTVVDTAGTANFAAKLWDGTTVISSSFTFGSAANIQTTMSLSGTLATPAANIRISVKDLASTSGAIKFNSSGNSKDSTIACVRIG